MVIAVRAHCNPLDIYIYIYIYIVIKNQHFIEYFRLLQTSSECENASKC